MSYRSRCAAAGSGPRGWDTSPCGPTAGSRSSSPGSRCKETRDEDSCFNHVTRRQLDDPPHLAPPRSDPAPPPHSLLGQQVFGQFVLVPEAAQRVHALQDIGVDLLGRGQRPDGHLPGDGLLRLRLVLSGSVAQTRTAETGTRRFLKTPEAFKPGRRIRQRREDGGSTHRYHVCFWICSNWKTEGRGDKGQRASQSQVKQEVHLKHTLELLMEGVKPSAFAALASHFSTKVDLPRLQPTSELSHNFAAFSRTTPTAAYSVSSIASGLQTYDTTS